MYNPDAETVSWARFAFASISVIGLMALLGWALKYFSMRGWIKARDPNMTLQIKSSLPLDARRRIVIVRCEDTEYHLLLGPTSDILLHQKPAPPSSEPVK